MIRYDVEITDPAQIEIDQIYLWLSSNHSPNAAHRWHVRLMREIAELREMPHRCMPAREAEEFDESIVRQHVYGSYRVLFHVIEPDESGEAVVRILHVVHGARDHF